MPEPDLRQRLVAVGLGAGLFLALGLVGLVIALVASRASAPSAAAATGPGLQFVDVAGDVGLDVTHSAFHWGVSSDPAAMMGGGACWIDVDNDGWLDLFVTDTWADGEWAQWNEGGGLPTTRLFRNDGGTFTEATAQWGAGVAARANGCVAADLDGDGYTDLYVTTSRANLLLWNDGGTGFTEGAAAAGADQYGWHTGVAAGDLDGDGRVDLVVAGYTDMNRPVEGVSTGFPNTYAPVADLVLHNEGAAPGERPTFREIGAEVGIEPHGPEYGLGVVLVDVDGDGDLDVYVANETQPNRLYRTDRDPAAAADGFRLVEVSEATGTDDANSGMGIGTGDLNGDLRPDLLVTNLAGQGHAALASVAGAGGPAYAPAFDEISDAGLDRTGWGASFGDLDLDGDLDLLVASGEIPIVDLAASAEPLSLFDNLGSGFTDASAAAGLDRLAPRNGRSVTLADYDNDGDLDAAVTAIGQPLALLENRSTTGHWLAVDTGTGRPGTVVKVESADGTTREQTVAAGGSWLSSEDPRLHFGLGAEDRVRRVEVHWPDGSVTGLDDVAADQQLTLGVSPPPSAP